MANPRQRNRRGQVADDQGLPTQDSLEELRSLLFEPEQVELHSLKERLENPVIRAQEVSRVLPDALALRVKQDTRISQELAPVLEESFTHSIRKRPQVIVDVMAPIMGPAIRKAISRAFRSMVQSTNQVLEKSLSWRGLRWRFEAWQTGKPFAEVVLLHTLRYRVEQVFLIHRESGLLLQHAATESVAIQDESMVSGMLSAIQTFVHDSFEVNSESNLDLLHIGELTVWIEQSPSALLAAVIRGTPPSSLRTLFQETLETIQIQFGEALTKFQGNTTPFEATRQNLEDCLQLQFAETKPRSLMFLWILLGLLVTILFMWWYPRYKENQQWEHFLIQLKTEPGLTVIEGKKEGGSFYVSGLRDALASDPMTLLQNSGVNSDRVTSHWEPYFALTPDIVQKRVIQILSPPPTVQMAVNDGVLSVKGIASEAWRDRARQLAPSMPGVLIYQDDLLVGEHAIHLKQFKKNLDTTYIYFDRGSASIPDSMQATIAQLSLRIREAQALTKSSDYSFHIKLIGHSDTTGTELRNRILSIKRAESVQSALVHQNLPIDLFTISGPGTQELLERKGEAAEERKRRVSFHVALSLKP